MTDSAPLSATPFPPRPASELTCLFGTLLSVLIGKGVLELDEAQSMVTLSRETYRQGVPGAGATVVHDFLIRSLNVEGDEVEAGSDCV